MGEPRRWPRFRLRWRRVVSAFGIAVVLDLVIVAAGTAVGSYELVTIQHRLQNPSLQLIASDAPDLRGRSTVASAAFELARVFWWPWQPIAATISNSDPRIRVLGAAGAMLGAAADGSSAARHAIAGLAPALAVIQHTHGAGGDAASRIVEGLQQGHAELLAALGDVGRLERDWASVDKSALPQMLQARVASIDRDLPNLRDALTAAISAADLLGATRPREYLLVPQNPWDLRATGGFVGTAAVLKVRQGRATLQDYQPSDAVDKYRPGYVPPPTPLLVYEHFGNWYYRDANWSPDFPTSAELLRYFYELGHGGRPDGVIAFDSYLLGPLLQITGPVKVPDSPVTLYADTAVDELDYIVNHTGTLNKDIAGAAYKAVFSRLRNLPSSQLASAARIIGKALSEKHLLLWLQNGSLEPILARHGWDGAIDPTRADYLYVVDTNVHYNKVNKRVRERISYRAIVRQDRSLRVDVRVDYANTATLDNIPKPQNNTLYEDFVRVLVPLGSRLLGTSGLYQEWPVTRAHNKTVFSGYLRVPSGAHVAVTFRYVVPPNALLVSSTYRLTIQKQPGTDSTPVSVQLIAGGPDVRMAGSATWSWRGSLRTDIALTAPISGGHARPIGLVYDAAPRVPVAPGAEIEPWTVVPRD